MSKISEEKSIELYEYILYTASTEDFSIKEVEKLISEGADVNYIKYTDSLLMIAVDNQRINLIKLLIDSGADINYIGSHQNTALLYACRFTENLDIIKLLINSKADLNIKSNVGNSSLNISVRERKENFAKLLIEAGADVNSVNNSNESVLENAIHYGISLGVIKLLIDYGADVKYLGNRDNNLLNTAITAKREFDVIKLLISLGVDVNHKNAYGNFSLIAAVYHDMNIKIIKLLIDSGADVNATDKDNDSALSFAGDLETTKLLLESGANPFVRYDSNCDECRELIEEYAWKQLKETDLNLARKLGKQVLNKDVWHLILLNERQRRLCKNLSKQTNKHLLTLFAIDIGADPNSLKSLNKAQLCGLIARQISRSERKGIEEVAINRRQFSSIKEKIYGLAQMYNINTEQSIDKIIKDISERLKE